MTLGDYLPPPTMKTFAHVVLVLAILLSPLTKTEKAQASEATSPSLAPPPATDVPAKAPDSAVSDPAPETSPTAPSAFEPGPALEILPADFPQKKETVAPLPAQPIILSVPEVLLPVQPAATPPPPVAAPELSPATQSIPELNQPVSPKRDQGRRMRLTGAIFGATAVALLGTGVVFTYKTHAYTNLVQSEPVFNEAWANRGSLYEKLQWTAYGLAAGTAITGSILYWYGKSQSSERTYLACFPVSGGVAVTAQRTF